MYPLLESLESHQMDKTFAHWYINLLHWYIKKIVL